MKKLTPVILAVALALSVLGVLGTRIYQAAAYGGAAPEILFDSEVISVPTGADEAALLAGVTATDAEDGDVTASLLVEGISGRNDDGTVQVTYAAFDSNHHVTKATRAVRYTDYTKPRFALTQPLVCRTGGNRVLSSYVTAHDSIDGDLSGRVKIALTDGSSLAIAGTHTAELRVTNSLGDTAAVPVTVEVSAADTNPAGITLTEYLIYLPAGGSYAPMDYVAGVGGSDSKSGVPARRTRHRITQRKGSAHEHDPDRYRNTISAYRQGGRFRRGYPR